MKVDSLRTLMVEELRDIYDAEKQLTRALPKMVKGAESEDLKDALTGHLEETKRQVDRLERVFEMLDLKPRSKACAGMKGLVEEGGQILESMEADHYRDAAIIGAAQRIEHYEMAAYGTARTYAEALGHPRIAEILDQILDEEKEADRKLSVIATAMLPEMHMEPARP